MFGGEGCGPWRCSHLRSHLAMLLPMLKTGTASYLCFLTWEMLEVAPRWGCVEMAWSRIEPACCPLVGSWFPVFSCTEDPPPPPPRTQIVAALLKVPSASLSDVKWEPGHLPRLRSPRPDASLPRALLSLPAPAHSPSPPGSCLSSMPWGFSS